MVQQTKEQFWQAEARSEETKQFIKNTSVLPAASSLPKRRSVLSWKAFVGIHPFGTCAAGRVSGQALTMPG